MSFIENILKKVVLDEATLTKKEQLTPLVYKIRLQSDAFKKIEFVPGHFLRLGIGIGKEDVSMKDKIRSYSVWDINTEEGYVDLAVATESKGVGAKWAILSQVGETVYFKWKKGNFLLDQTADSYLFIGDLSALSHLYILNRNLPANKQVESIIYSKNINELFEDTTGNTPFNFHALPPNSKNEIISLTAEIISKMNGNKMVYIAGDSRICVALNQYFRKEMNWDKLQIKTKPFWNPDKKGLE